MLDADRVEVVSAHREGLGVRLAVRTRLLGLPAFTEPMEVIGWEPPRRLVLRHGGLVAGEGTWTLTPEPGGTRFVWTRGRPARGADGRRGRRTDVCAGAPLVDAADRRRSPGGGDRIRPVAPVIARPRASVERKQGSPVGPG